MSSSISKQFSKSTDLLSDSSNILFKSLLLLPYRSPYFFVLFCFRVLTSSIEKRGIEVLSAQYMASPSVSISTPFFNISMTLDISFSVLMGLEKPMSGFLFLGLIENFLFSISRNMGRRPFGKLEIECLKIDFITGYI